jgi:hypothetical protein
MTRINKKADVVEQIKMLRHVGLLSNGPPSISGLPFI